MNSIIVDTNPLAYIYHAVPDFDKNYASLLGELARKNIELSSLRSQLFKLFP